MIEITREVVAYGIVGLIVVVAVPVAIRVRAKRHRERLRRRGIKTYGH